MLAAITVGCVVVVAGVSLGAELGIGHVGWGSAREAVCDRRPSVFLPDTGPLQQPAQ